MTISQLKQFYVKVHQDKLLQERLQAQVNLATVCSLAVQLGLEQGYNFTIEEVKDSIINQSQPWNVSRYWKTSNSVTSAIDANAHLRQGYTYIMNGNLLAALESYTQAAKINPQLADAYCGKGYVNTDLGRLHQAIEDYSQAITVDPSHADAHLNRGICKADIGDTQSALSDAEIAAKLFREQNQVNKYERARAFIANLRPTLSVSNSVEFVDETSDWANKKKGHSVLTEFADIMIKGAKDGLKSIADRGYRDLGRGIVAVGVQSDNDGSFELRMIGNDPDVCYLTRQDLSTYNQGNTSKIKLMEESLDNYDLQTEFVVCFTHSYVGSVVIKVKL